MGKVWTLLLLPALALAQSVVTNLPTPPRIVHLQIPVNNAAAIESQKVGKGATTTLRAVLALPANFDARRSWPVLLVTAPSGGSAVQSLGGYTNTTLAAGWVAIA